MSIKHKYVEPVLLFLSVYIFHFYFCQIGELLFIYAFQYLAELFPSIVKVVSPFESPEKYQLYLRMASTSGAIVCMAIMNYICLRIDNRKFEFIISKTDGKYELRDGIRLYFKEFLGSDMLVTSVPVAILVFSAYFIPKKFIDMGLSLVFGLGASLVDFYYPIEAIILVVLCSVITRTIAIPFVVRTWRALWLSGSV